MSNSKLISVMNVMMDIVNTRILESQIILTDPKEAYTKACEENKTAEECQEALQTEIVKDLSIIAGGLGLDVDGDRFFVMSNDEAIEFYINIKSVINSKYKMFDDKGVDKANVIDSWTSASKFISSLKKGALVSDFRGNKVLDVVFHHYYKKGEK